MKAGEITDVTLEGMYSGKYDFIRINFPNADMVGHTGNMLAVEIAVEAVDLSVGRLMEAARETGAILVITADHGNADQMYEEDGDTSEPRSCLDGGESMCKTSHSLNPVPVYFYDPEGLAAIKLADVEHPGISSLAATCLTLMGFVPPEGYDPSLVAPP